ncbi:MAG: hypothetical protein L0H64_14470 [Pseudonocardia sp.]|nr:hypothetical protein [Pseudonocardia sp.]
MHHWTGHSFAEVAKRINPIARGWMQYYGAFYRTELYPLLLRINAYLMRRAGSAGSIPVTGDRHAGICGSPGVRFPRATRQLR